MYKTILAFILIFKNPQILGVQNKSRFHVFFYICSIFWQQDKLVAASGGIL